MLKATSRKTSSSFGNSHEEIQVFTARTKRKTTVGRVDRVPRMRGRGEAPAHPLPSGRVRAPSQRPVAQADGRR